MILISHNMPHVFEIADRIHVVRLGRRAAVLDPKQVSMSDTVAVMTGAMPARTSPPGWSGPRPPADAPTWPEPTPTHRQNGFAPSMRGSNQQGVRQFNERIVLQAIRLHGAIPKADLARLTQLSTQTVVDHRRNGSLDDDLLSSRTVYAAASASPPVPLSLNPEGVRHRCRSGGARHRGGCSTSPAMCATSRRCSTTIRIRTTARRSPPR